LKTGQPGFPGTSVATYQSTLRNVIKANISNLALFLKNRSPSKQFVDTRKHGWLMSTTFDPKTFFYMVNIQQNSRSCFEIIFL
jgi:hypothetical protein